MALAARKYSYYETAAPQRAPRTNPRPDIRVIPGRRADNPALQSLSPQAVKAFKFVVAFVVFFALVCGLRVAMSVATVEALQVNQELESQLETIQAEGNELEIQRSILAAPDRIKSEAAKLGMVPAGEVTYLTVDIANTLSKNADGSVSLSNTIRNLENSAALAK